MCKLNYFKPDNKSYTWGTNCWKVNAFICSTNLVVVESDWGKDLPDMMTSGLGILLEETYLERRTDGTQLCMFLADKGIIV